MYYAIYDIDPVSILVMNLAVYSVDSECIVQYIVCVQYVLLKCMFRSSMYC